MSATAYASIGRVSVMGRYALDALRKQITGCRMTNIAQTNDANHPFILIDHRQSTELQLLHVPHRLDEVIVLPAAVNSFRHHIARLCATGIEVVARKAFADDVAVCHHPDQSVVLPDRNAPDVMLPHQGVFGLAQSTPLCITSLTFMASLRR